VSYAAVSIIYKSRNEQKTNVVSQSNVFFRLSSLSLLMYCHWQMIIVYNGICVNR